MNTNGIEPLWVIVLVLISVLSVVISNYYLTKSFFENETKKRQMEFKSKNQKLITPAKLQAYERVVLLLERISPNSLVMRVYKNGLSSKMLQSELIKNIRHEFEHNLSQQIYISNKAWELVNTSKEETIKLINIASTRVKEDASGMELANAIIEVAGQLGKLPTQTAIEALKLEFSNEF